ncbi:hypothetical protein DFH07DRAFT_947094 [Mycena maculata]|uniref:Uncharacterized protein n=1 Tax=Mycena maculata TaxID=230809 RepID=A0AAD7HGI6_9AGAR|nr:hypothetical protein DFH07DRAFT_947094 [Mycena maculata]
MDNYEQLLIILPNLDFPVFLMRDPSIDALYARQSSSLERPRRDIPSGITGPHRLCGYSRPERILLLRFGLDAVLPVPEQHQLGGETPETLCVAPFSSQSKNCPSADWRGMSSGGRMHDDNYHAFPWFRLIDIGRDHTDLMDVRLSASTTRSAANTARQPRSKPRTESLARSPHEEVYNYYKYLFDVDGNSFSGPAAKRIAGAQEWARLQALADDPVAME